MEKFKHKKSLGQHFLHDSVILDRQNFINNVDIIDKIVSVSNIDKDTLVIEIGPGMGVLSKRIVPLSGHTILFEIDYRLESILKRELEGNDNYTLVIGDFLDINIKEYVAKFSFKKIYVVANLPYYITSLIVKKITTELYPDKMVIMVQNEVADRLSATVNHSDYGYITVWLNSYYDIVKEFIVDRRFFTPSPNVDSAVISMVKNNKLSEKRENFDRLISDAFRYKRKNLKNNLKIYNIDVINKILNENGLNLSNRAEEIPLKVFISLSKADIFKN